MARSSKGSASGVGVFALLFAVAALLNHNSGSPLIPPSTNAAAATRATSTGTQGSPQSTPAGAAAAANAPTARAALAKLTVAPRVKTANPPYHRTDYGPAWTDVDHNGCKQRADALYAWLDTSAPRTVKRKGACAHEVYAGTWHDPYTGKTITLTNAKDPKQAQLLQLDHVVPLSEAAKSGASLWPADRKLAFANDLSNLIPVDGPTNQSKGDSDPAAWKPRLQYQCAYAQRWIAVKTKWSLTVDPSEKAALTQMLNSCTK